MFNTDGGISCTSSTDICPANQKASKKSRFLLSSSENGKCYSISLNMNDKRRKKIINVHRKSLFVAIWDQSQFTGKIGLKKETTMKKY